MIPEHLKNKNDIPIHSISHEGFKEYGEVLSYDTDELVNTLLQTPIPEEKNIYVASDEILEKIAVTQEMSFKIFGGTEYQMGYCNGRNVALGALEWHDCSEIAVAGSALVLLLAKYSDIRNNIIDSSKVKAFYLQKGQAIRLYPMVLHFAPCAVSDDGFRCCIGLTKGTNEALDSKNIKKYAPLKAVNKWMLAHPERTDLVESGAMVGIVGENIKINH